MRFDIAHQPSYAITTVHLDAGESIQTEGGAMVSMDAGITIGTKAKGGILKSLGRSVFASEGAIMLQISGQGQLVMASFGALDTWTLGPGETYTVDTGHLVSMTDDIGFKVRKVGNWKSTLFSGEGLVVDLTGPGTFTTQSRSQDAFLSWLIPRLPSSNTSSA